MDPVGFPPRTHDAERPLAVFVFRQNDDKESAPHDFLVRAVLQDRDSSCHCNLGAALSLGKLKAPFYHQQEDER